MSDRVKAFTEARRVIKLGGRFVFSVPGLLRHNPVAECVQATLTALMHTDPPTFVTRVLHGYADSEAIDDDLTDAGFTDAVYTSVDLPFAAASARDVAVGFCLGTDLRQEIEARAQGDVERIVDAVTAALEQRFGAGPIDTTMRAQFISAAG